MVRVLGLDLGISSCGFGLVDLADGLSAQPITTGARTFNAAENPQNGESLALPRRTARTARRRLRRRRVRLNQLLQIFSERLKPTIPPNSPRSLTNPWHLRAAAMDRILTADELAIALYHIAKSRGMQLTRTEKDDSAETSPTEEKSKEKEAAKAGMKRLESAFRASTFPTIGCYLAAQERQRNVDKDYRYTIHRQLLQEEVGEIFARQRQLGSNHSSQVLQQEYTDIAFYQRPLRSSLALVGHCSLEPNEKRAPKHAYSSETFVVSQKIAHLNWVIRGERHIPTDDQRATLLAMANDLAKVTYGQVRKALNIPSDARINHVAYDRKKNMEEAEKATFVEMKGLHTLRKAVDKVDKNLWETFRRDTGRLDAIATILCFEQNEDIAGKKLAKMGLDDKLIKAFLPISFNGVLHLSLKAIRNLLPYLRAGHSYAESVALAGYNFVEQQQGNQDRLPPLPLINNPVVNRALAQARRVINAVIAEYGMPDRIHIELANELGKSKSKRDEIAREQVKNRKAKEAALASIQQELGLADIRGNLKEKLLLWHEQRHECPYSQQKISYQDIENGQVEVDHILPFSRSFDNSRANRVLVFAKENQNKQERTPFEWLGANPARWQDFCTWVDASALPYRKKRQLLLRDFQEEGWKRRNLQDTQYIGRLLSQHIKTHLNFGDDESPTGKQKRRVAVRPGRLTAWLRYHWGVHDLKDRENDDRHHAMDALIVACTTESMVQRATNYNKRGIRKEDQQAIPTPWPDFRNSVKKQLDDIFVSRAPQRTVTGKGHKATVYGLRQRLDDKGQEKTVVLERVAVENLKPEDLDKLLDGDGRNSWLKRLLAERLAQHGGDGKKAFVEPLRMPGNDAIIRHVKLVTDINVANGLKLPDRGNPSRPGFVPNGDMKRVDVYSKANKFYLVPVYTHHIARGILPLRAITANQPQEKWPVMDDSYLFKFSLFPYDLIGFAKKAGDPLEYVYYRRTHSGTAGVTLSPHFSNHPYHQINGVGSKTLTKFEKFSVTILGEIRPAKAERDPRTHGVAQPAHQPSGQT